MHPLPRHLHPTVGRWDMSYKQESDGSVTHTPCMLGTKCVHVFVCEEFQSAREDIAYSAEKDISANYHIEESRKNKQ